MGWKMKTDHFKLFIKALPVLLILVLVTNPGIRAFLFMVDAVGARAVLGLPL